MAVDWIGLSYAVLVSAGGVLGFLKAASPLCSLVCCLACWLPSALIRRLRTPGMCGFRWVSRFGLFNVNRELSETDGLSLNAVTAGTLAAVMGLRFLNSWKFMPAGLMTLASALMLVKIITGMLKTRPHKT
uniref:Transmembrane protein 14C n=1 Tax=Amphiprion ocellaris TaxID=80972 RepID=A0AAQ5YLZ7_AMPOC